MFKSNSIFIFLICISLLALYGCTSSDYTKLVKEELNKGRQDSLFLGLHFGMSRNEFFDRCMALNREHIATNGIKGYNVLHKIQDSVGTIMMHFYPDFHNDTIYQMKVIFTYQNWSPWDTNTQPDSLQSRVRNMLDRWYGSGYVEIKWDKKQSACVKVKGNRRIVIFKDGEMDVQAIFTDLIAEEEIKKIK